MAGEERYLVNALTGQQCTAGDGVSEAVHRGQGSVRYRNRPAGVVQLVKDRKGRIAALIDRIPLSGPERTPDVRLATRPTHTGPEHVVIRLREARGELVTSQDERQLARGGPPRRIRVVRRLVVPSGPARLQPVRGPRVASLGKPRIMGLCPEALTA